MGFKGHRWRNSFYTIQFCANLPYKQAILIGHVVNLVNNTLISMHWSGSCAIYLFILKWGEFFFNWRTSFYVPAKIAPFSFSTRGAILWVFWFLSWAIYFDISVFLHSQQNSHSTRWKVFSLWHFLWTHRLEYSNRATDYSTFFNHRERWYFAPPKKNWRFVTTLPWVPWPPWPSMLSVARVLEPQRPPWPLPPSL